ncbi:DUF6963 family protein [Bordetella genomosp. 5]|uniref:Uncharacterized protein n=1 Tax=Bordetella genomosp. 5 TaxID=1395608 RepID=A0A261TAS9_9BORD|nr:hypothetical protein [Bordetella genomosp. 5]OZI46738.1 hypothetical protein CAL25_18810 [Bordetella genomosp. 5]
MTIGVAAAGPHAGAAVYDAVLTAELLGRGAIGGFAVLAVLLADGRLEYRTTQREGISSLDLPAAWRDAPYAAVISSGPDRPEPLTQFLAGEAGVGLVTGHRLPNLAGTDGVPLNQSVLRRMAQGEAPQAAVDAVLGTHAQWDAGLLALDTGGRIGLADTARVLRRNDLGRFERRTPAASLALLHNSIYARGDLAAQVGERAWCTLTGAPAALRFVTLTRATTLGTAPHDRVDIDAQGHITAIATANPRLARLDRRGTVIYLGTEVWSEGAMVGHATTELYVEVRDGRVLPASLAANNTLLMRSAHVAP